MKAKRLDRRELDKRARITLNKSIKSVDDGFHGVMSFGQNNDYPQLIELITDSSVDAKAATDIYSKFLSGFGFENESINNIIIGKNQQGQDVTLRSLLKDVCMSIAVNQGAYVHRNIDYQGNTIDAHLKQFKSLRFSKPDDIGFPAKILYNNNWENDADKGKFNTKDIVAYDHFSINQDVINANLSDVSGDTVKDKIKGYKGQIAFKFLDTRNLYPLATLDSAYLDADTQNQIGLYKNRQLRNGFFDKVLFMLEKSFQRDDVGNIIIDDNGVAVQDNTIVDTIMDFMGADGETVMAVTADIDPETNKFPENVIHTEKIEGNVNDKLFENWENSISNNIRKPFRGLPQVLINYENSQLGAVSGEAIKLANEYYNAMTHEDREMISEFIKSLFQGISINPVLRENTNWDIKPLQLLKYDNDGTDNTNGTTTD